jgi:hypothetical protein
METQRPFVRLKPVEGMGNTTIIVAITYLVSLLYEYMNVFQTARALTTGACTRTSLFAFLCPPQHHNGN